MPHTKEIHPAKSKQYEQMLLAALPAASASPRFLDQPIDQFDVVAGDINMLRVQTTIRLLFMSISSSSHYLEMLSGVPGGKIWRLPPRT